VNRNAVIPGAGVLACTIASVFLWSAPAPASGNRNLEFTSDPPGAEVFLLQGTRKLSLGTTPLDYPAEFHSAVSILRFRIQKPGFEPATVEVGAGRTKVATKLSRRRLVADSSALSDPALRSLQARIAPGVEAALARVPASKGSLRCDVAPPVRLVTLEQGTYLIVPAHLEGKDVCGSRTSLQKSQRDVRMIWEQVGSGIVVPLAVSIRGQDAKIGIVLDMDCAQAQADFSVSSSLETSLEMECFPGMVQKEVWDYCAHKDPDPSYPGDFTRWKCRGGFVTQSVHDPCAYKRPVTRSSVKATPLATIGTAKRKVQFVISQGIVEKAAGNKDIYDLMGRLLTSESGEPILRQGDLPSNLPNIP
jgi:hypothetical protein